MEDTADHLTCLKLLIGVSLLFWYYNLNRIEFDEEYFAFRMSVFKIHILITQATLHLTMTLKKFSCII